MLMQLTIHLHRLSLYLIGYDDFQIKNISNVEIGARRKRAKSTSTINWAKELSEALNIQKRFLSKKRFLILCFTP